MAYKLAVFEYFFFVLAYRYITHPYYPYIVQNVVCTSATPNNIARLHYYYYILLLLLRFISRMYTSKVTERRIWYDNLGPEHICILNCHTQCRAHERQVVVISRLLSS